MSEVLEPGVAGPEGAGVKPPGVEAVGGAVVVVLPPGIPPLGGTSAYSPYVFSIHEQYNTGVAQYWKLMIWVAPNFSGTLTVLQRVKCLLFFSKEAIRISVNLAD